MEIRENDNPKRLRAWLAMLLVRLAQKIYPKSPAVMAFYTQLLHDEMIYGQSIVRFDPKELFPIDYKNKVTITTDPKNIEFLPSTICF